MRMDLIVLKCAARSKRTGLPCANPVAHIGGRYCRMHFGNSPHEIERVKQRFLEARGDAVDRLADAVRPRPACPTCGGAGFDALQLAASKVILENCPPLKFSEDADDRWLEWATEAEVQMIAETMARCIERMRDEGIGVPEGVIDVTPENVPPSEQSQAEVYADARDAFDASNLPSPRGTRPEADVNEALSTPIVPADTDDDEAEEFEV